MGQGGKKNKNYAIQSKRKMRSTKKDSTLLIVLLAVVVVAIVALVLVFASKSPEVQTTSGNNTPTQNVNNTLTNIGATGIDKTAVITNVAIKTSKGEIDVALRPDLMPKTVANFMKLVKNNYYKGLTFHRVEGWVIQGGDPTISGRAAPNWTLTLETSPLLNNVRGAIGMARSTDPNSANSQFYIVKNDESSIDGQYAIFGNVTKGMDVVDKIAIGDKITSVTEIK